MDLVNSAIRQGLTLEHLEEFHAEPDAHDPWFYPTPAAARADRNRKYAIEHNPYAALPAWLGWSAVKRS